MKPQHILIVDDNDDNLYLLRTLLGKKGYEIAEASNGADALKKARQTLPDLIITDILMPVMDGFTFCRECKKDPVLKTVPIIIYTATYTDERDRDLALDIGAARFIVKPEEPAAFVAAIREVLDSTPVQTTPPPAHDEEEVYLKKYSETLIRKLEARYEQLKTMNAERDRQLDELRRWQAVMIDNSERNQALKREINALLARLGELPRYTSQPKDL